MTMTWETVCARNLGRAGLMAICGAGLCLLGACSSAKPEYKYPEQIGGSEQHDPLGQSTDTDEHVGRMTGPGGLLEFKKSDKNKDKKEAKIGVNKYLWRATLDTLSFMPLASADPIGGVIITDWYSDAQAPQERFKVTVYILAKELRADGIRVSVFRQVRSDSGTWVNQAPAADTRVQIENAILTRARQLRVAKMNEE